MCLRGTRTLVMDKKDVYECIGNVAFPNCRRGASNPPAMAMCTECGDGYYMLEEGGDGNCLKATVDVPNCMFYSSATTCGACESGYYPVESAKSCQAQTAAITECDIYKSANLCLICRKGFRPSVDERLCEKETANIGCNERSAICESCRAFHWAVDYTIA